MNPDVRSRRHPTSDAITGGFKGSGWVGSGAIRMGCKPASFSSTRMSLPFRDNMRKPSRTPSLSLALSRLSCPLKHLPALGSSVVLLVCPAMPLLDLPIDLPPEVHPSARVMWRRQWFQRHWRILSNITRPRVPLRRPLCYSGYDSGRKP